MSDTIESPVDYLTPPSWATESVSTDRSDRTVPFRFRRVEHDVEYDPSSETFSELRDKVWHAIPKCEVMLRSTGIDLPKQKRLIVDTFDALTDCSEDIWNGLVREALNAFREADLIPVIEVGSVKYVLKRPIRVMLKPVLDHEFEISSDLLPDVLVGRGLSIEQAREDFMIQVHREFQSLVRLRPHKRNEEQTRRWTALTDVIDVDRYWDETPVVLMEVGHVESVTVEGYQLAWLDGDRRETVSLKLAPPEFAALCQGDWFEALVERHATTKNLQAIRFVKPIEPLSVMSENELREWFASLPRFGKSPS